MPPSYPPPSSLLGGKGASSSHGCFFLGPLAKSNDMASLDGILQKLPFRWPASFIESPIVFSSLLRHLGHIIFPPTSFFFPPPLSRISSFNLNTLALPPPLTHRPSLLVPVPTFLLLTQIEYKFAVGASIWSHVIFAAQSCYPWDPVSSFAFFPFALFLFSTTCWSQTSFPV